MLVWSIIGGYQGRLESQRGRGWRACFHLGVRQYCSQFWHIVFQFLFYFAIVVEFFDGLNEGGREAIFDEYLT